MSPLTTRQRKVLAFIVACQNDKYTPTLREMAVEIGAAAPVGVMCHLRALEHKGYILRSPFKSRRIRVLDTGLAETLWGNWEL